LAGPFFLFFILRLPVIAFLVCIDVQAAVYATSDGEERWPVGMKAIAALGAANNDGKGDNDTKQYQPDHENLDHGIPATGRL